MHPQGGVLHCLLLVLLGLLLTAEQVYGKVGCSINAGKSGTINLSSLTRSTFYLVTNQYFTFYVNICDNAVRSCNGVDYVSSYYLQAKPDQCVSALGTLSSQKITLQDSTGKTGVFVEYSGGNGRSTKIKINCDPSVKTAPADLNLQYSGSTQNEGVEYHNFEMTTAYACPVVFRRRIVGVGGAFLIIIPCLIAIYLVIGSLVMKLKYQATGWDILVHRQYLQEIPKLIFEGVLFIGDLFKLVVPGKKYQEV